MIKTGPRRFKFGILVGVAVFLSGAPGYAQDIENSKLNSYTVVGPPEASVSSPKQNSYAVVGTPDANMSASKHNSYAVVGPLTRICRRQSKTAIWLYGPSVP